MAVPKLESYFSKVLKSVDIIGIKPSEAKIKERGEELEKMFFIEQERVRLEYFVINLYGGYFEAFECFFNDIMVNDPIPVMQSNDYYLKIFENIQNMKMIMQKNDVK